MELRLTCRSQDSQIDLWNIAVAASDFGILEIPSDSKMPNLVRSPRSSVLFEISSAFVLSRAILVVQTWRLPNVYHLERCSCFKVKSLTQVTFNVLSPHLTGRRKLQAAVIGSVSL